MAVPGHMVYLGERQASATPTPTSLKNPHPPHCTAFNLPANGILVINETETYTLASSAIYQPFCSEAAILGIDGTVPISEFQDPFVASVIPQIFVIGAMLVVAGILVIILIITPRTSFAFGGGNFMGGGRRTILGSAAGRSPVLGSGGRPWLQKVAATAVFISLLVASVNSMRVAEDQYNQGYEDAEALTKEVVGSLELRVIRVISDTFLWLAQVQTLIRLFPRHKEKVIIKWTGFFLITLDTIFSILDNFVIDQDSPYLFRKPREFGSPISALWYLFQLSLSVIYMLSVYYYSVVKRRFAYFHSKMRNICIVALLSMISVAIPVGFFVLDISNEHFIGWGDYVRWVGAAAASVVVWEWVERIEALERDERKDGILGREIFEGDEMQQGVNWKVSGWPKRRRRGGGKDRKGGDGSTDPGGSSVEGSTGSTTAVNSSRIRLAFLNPVAAVKGSSRKQKGQPKDPIDSQPPIGAAQKILGAPIDLQTEMPPHVASPVSRSDTTSAASTVYAVIHHPVQNSTPINNDPAISTMHSGAPQESRNIPEAYANQPPSQPSSRSTPSNPRSQQTSGNSPSSTDRPLRSRLARPFRRGTPNSDAEQDAPPSPASLDSPTMPKPPPAAGSRGRFRLRRGAPEPPPDLPLYVIRGGQNGGDIVVEEQRSEPAESGAQPATAMSPTTPSHERSNIVDSPTPNESTRSPHEPPPPFSAVQSPPPAIGAPFVEPGQQHSSQTTPIPLSSSPVSRTGSSTRPTRRSPLSMPVLVERDSDAVADNVPTTVPEQTEEAAPGEGSSRR